jgi:hypothetical protein
LPGFCNKYGILASLPVRWCVLTVSIGSIVLLLAGMVLVPCSHAQDPDSAPLLMKPFRVLAEMIELRPIIDKQTTPYRVIALRVNGVLKRSPAEKAGIKKGMIITQVQGMAVAGLTEKELHFNTARLAATSQNTIVLKARKSYSSKTEIVFEIPMPHEPRPQE